MEKSKIAVFGTSEIFKHWYPRIGLPIKAEIESSDGRTIKFVSTGSLEKALEEGYDVHVVSTRSSLGKHDDWWLELIDESKVLLADKKYEGEYAENWGTDEHVDKANSAWINLYTLLDLDYPPGTSFGNDVEEDILKYAHWTTARSELKSKHRIRLGTDFKVYTPRQKEFLAQMEKKKSALLWKERI